MDDMDGDDQVFAAEQITKKRLRKGRTEYLVKWKGAYVSIPLLICTWFLKIFDKLDDLKLIFAGYTGKFEID